MADSSNLDFGATVRSLASGQRFFGRFTLVRPLGRGGMGVVWLAHDGKLELEVAVKFLPEAVGADESAVAELARETRRARELRHQHIVGVYDFHQDERLAGISMEWVDGGTLTSRRLQQPDQVFQPAQLVAWVRQMCSALEYAHEDARVVHRDLKPANLMIDARARLKIADFGISASVSESVTRVSRMAASSGSPPYMSPQQMLGGRPSPSDDIYALGATLYELLTGKPPFFSGNIMAQAQSVVPASLAERRLELEIPSGNIPAAWEETIAACLAKKPEDRPRSAWEVAARLQGKAVTAAPDSIGDAPTVVLPIKKKEPGQSPSSPEAEPAPPSSPVKARRPRVPRSPARSEPVNRIGEPERSERKEDASGIAPEKPVSSPAPVVAKPAPAPLTAKPVPAPITAKPVPVPVPAKPAEQIPVRKHRFVGLVVIAAVVIGGFVFWKRDSVQPTEQRREITGPEVPGGDGAVSTGPPGAPVIGRNAPDAPALGPWKSKSGMASGQPWENTLGMKFVPVPGTEVLFCVWETRVQDYEAFSQAMNRGWTKSGDATHPAVNVSWEDAQAFCQWLTERERAGGRLEAGQEYRLARDWEWSVAVGLARESGNSPKEKNEKNRRRVPVGPAVAAATRGGQLCRCDRKAAEPVVEGDRRL